MTSTQLSYAPVITVEDEFGIVYHVENAQQFWSELEDLIHFPNHEIPTLSQLDSTLKRYLALCAAYHEQYLQSHLQLDHACDVLLNSELFAFHSERMCEILVENTRSASNIRTFSPAGLLIPSHQSTDPHSQFVFYNVLLAFGRRKAEFFRSHKRWQPLMPLLMDHVLVEMDPDTEDVYSGSQASSTGTSSVVMFPVPIEAKLRSLGVRLLYEVCRVQKLSVQDLRIFDDAFIDYLFDLVEQTRDMSDETFNYSVIKLIASVSVVALNEQFMVASLSARSSELVDPKGDAVQHSSIKNRVLRVLMRRLNFTKTFGENMIFMLNRAQRTPEDLCMQLLVLKILYLLFTTPGTSEYFYTNDLCVLVDVFLRELVDLDDDSESLRHTYLRVLHPLLTKTQMRTTPYKRAQILHCLESLIGHANIREINPTTKRLVERCLGGDWCVQLRKTQPQSPTTSSLFSEPRSGSPGSSGSDTPHTHASTTASHLSPGRTEAKGKSLKSSKSVEHLHSKTPKGPLTSSSSYSLVQPGLDTLRRPSNASSISLAGVASTALPSPRSSHHPKRAGTADSILDEPSPPSPIAASSLPVSPVSHRHHTHHTNGSNASDSGSESSASVPGTTVKQRRSAPPPPGPPKRRKPPAIPVGKTNGGATITAIKSSIPTSPLARTSYA